MQARFISSCDSSTSRCDESPFSLPHGKSYMRFRYNTQQIYEEEKKKKEEEDPQEE